MSVRENVEYGLRVKVPKEERARRAEDALEMVQLSGYGDRSPASSRAASASASHSPGRS